MTSPQRLVKNQGLPRDGGREWILAVRLRAIAGSGAFFRAPAVVHGMPRYTGWTFYGAWGGDRAPRHGADAFELCDVRLMAWRLNYRGGVSGVPVELDGILPERLRGMSLSEIERLPIAVGNRQVPLGDLFAVQAVGDDAERMDLDGDLSGVHWVGHRMSRGSIHVQGNVGRHLGSEMRGGRIEVAGSAGDWLGAELRGGQIRVQGSAGHLVGAAYRGSRRGMTGGSILVHGDVGNELGHSMRRGLLSVGGAAGDLIGFNMLAGSIMVFGSVGIRHGAGMRRGTIGLFGAQRPELLPSFRFACRFSPLAVSLALRHLTTLGVTIAAAFVDQVCDVFNGDLICEGRGELLIGAS